MNIPPQASYLYAGKWTLESDAILCESLVKLKKETGWLIKQFPSYFLATAGKQIEEKLGVQFDEFELIDRVDSLHTRYLTFKEVCRQKGVQWVPEIRSVIAPDCLWKKMCKVFTSFFLLL